MYRPIVAIIGRPNVGKSSLFNRLLRRRQAIVSPISGTTRDRLYAPVTLNDREVDIVDTAGISGDLAAEHFGHEMLEQVQLAVQEADVLIFVLDGQSGMTHDDQKLAEIIRKAQTPTVVFVNKVDSPDQDLDQKMLNLGIGQTVLGSLAQRRGTDSLLEAVEKILPPEEAVVFDPTKANIPRVTLAGRPNVGKSTLFNALTGDQRMIVSDIPGTTRDAVDTEVRLEDGTRFIITDTAGLRRRGKIGRADKIEQYSVLRTMRAIDQSDVVLLVVDAAEGLTRGDAHVADYALQQGKRLITVLNKSDLIDPRMAYTRRFPFMSRQPMVFVSAKDGVAIDQLLELLVQALRTED